MMAQSCATLCPLKHYVNSGGQRNPCKQLEYRGFLQPMPRPARVVYTAPEPRNKMAPYLKPREKTPMDHQYLPFVPLLIIIVLSGFRIAQEYQRGVVFRLGRYRGLRGPGLFWILPLGLERA